MQAILETLNQEIAGPRIEWRQAAVAPLSWLTRLFGCWHTELSRPLTLRAESYRTCLECGARRQFDAARWELTGPYYFAPPVPLAEQYREAQAEVTVQRAREEWRTTLRAA